MPSGLGQQFQARLSAAEARLSAVSEDAASQPFREGGWMRKELLGHLLDSAANNHQRFVRAALDGHWIGPGYAQEAWVQLHGYYEMAWAELLASWRERNATLSRIVSRIDESTLDAPCKIGDHDTVTLRFVIEDYLRHMDHHIDQITGFEVPETPVKR
jgi:hypothetical protein